MAGETDKTDVTELLAQWRGGRTSALNDLAPLVYAELREIARKQLRRERTDPVLQPTMLAHEAFIRLMDQRRTNWQSRAHFLALAAELMRRVLVEHARRKKAAKRGGGEVSVSLHDTAGAVPPPDVEVLALHRALSRLSEIDPRQARVVEMRYFGGLTVEESAEVLGISPATVKREWEVARLFLHREMRGTASE